MSSSNQWFFAHEGERGGPIDVQTLAGMIRAGHLPADVFVCREGMDDWLPANEVVVTDKKASQPATVEKPDRSGAPNKLPYALGAILVVTLAGSVAYSAIQSKKHQKAIGDQNKKHKEEITQLKETDKSPVKGSLEFAKIQKENRRLKELEATYTRNQHHHVKTISDLNASNIKYIADNRKLLNEHREATNRLAHFSQPGGEIDKRVKEANQRATLAEATALASKKKLTETIQQAEAQAAQLQKQIDRHNASDILKRQEMDQANKALADKLKSTSTQLTTASNQILSLKRQLGESPLKIGTPNGPKPPVSPDYFTVIGSTDDQFNFAVINKGSADGVKIGDKFRVVSRESRETIAQLTITRVQAMIAVGNPGTIGIGKLKPKDLVYRE